MWTRPAAKGAAIAALLAVMACGENRFTEPGTGGGGGNQFGSIQGQVTAAGVGVGGVRIVVVNRDSTVTNGQGVYQFTNVPSATYTVSLRVPANYTLPIGENSSQTVRVSTGGIATANWILRQDPPSNPVLVPSNASGSP
jgi:hypothetical protein